MSDTPIAGAGRRFDSPPKSPEPNPSTRWVIDEGPPTSVVGGRRPPRRAAWPARTIAVAVHDIEPATFERCALIRDWLSDHGVDPATLLVIPARDLHPLGQRSPEMVSWLQERRRAGDAIAQHGFQHQRAGRRTWSGAVRLTPPTGRAAEFVGLDRGETRRALDAGWRTLKLAGIEPVGFVAPAYAYTPVLREALGGRYRWWAGRLRLYRAPSAAARAPLSPAWTMATGGPLRRVLSPSLLRAGALAPGHTLCLDLHPADLQYSRHMLALEWVLRRSAGRRAAITYDDLAQA